MAHVALPTGLPGLPLSFVFAQTMDNVAPPMALQSFAFGDKFNQRIDTFHSGSNREEKN